MKISAYLLKIISIIALVISVFLKGPIVVAQVTDNIGQLLSGEFIDPRDGNHYNFVKIGNQVWMAENLAYLPVVHSNAEFIKQGFSSEPGYGVYGYNGRKLPEAKAQSSYTTYGVLYNWWAAMDGTDSSSSNQGRVKGACPTGWHLPGDDEWSASENYLKSLGYNYDGTTTGFKLAKSLSFSTLWATSTNAGAVGNTDYPEKINSTGFNALPGGYRSHFGEFLYIKLIGGWWTSTEDSPTNAWFRLIGFDVNFVLRDNIDKKNGYFIRCLKD